MIFFNFRKGVSVLGIAMAIGIPWLLANAPFTVFEIDQVQVRPYMQKCNVDKSCMLVETSCGNCCDYQAINRQYKQSFQSKYDKICDDYEGAVCDCVAMVTSATCLNQVCVGVK